MASLTDRDFNIAEGATPDDLKRFNQVLSYLAQMSPFSP
jgi:hypothetical protein